MARRDDLVEFARVYGLKIVTVADIIEYRLRNETLIQRVAEARLPTSYGEFRALVYRNLVDLTEHMVLVMGEIDPALPVLVQAPSRISGRRCFRLSGAEYAESAAAPRWPGLARPARA